MTDWDFTRVVDDVDDNLAAYHNELIDAIWGFNGPRGFLINGKISVTVSSDDLIVAIKTLAGSDPSATDPVGVRIGDTVRLITAALAVTAPDATNWCNAGSAELATQEIDYFVYLGYNATDGVVIGFSRIPYASQYSDFSATSTNEKFCKISTITTAAATDYYEVVGRFAATLSAGAGYTWTVPTFTAINLINTPIYETRLLAWLPTWTNLTIGNAVVKYRYRLRRREVKIHANVQWGTTTSIGGSGVNFSLPFSISPSEYNAFSRVPTGFAKLYDLSGGPYAGLAQIITNTCLLLAQYIPTTYLLGINISATIPFTWTTSDEMYAESVYFI